MAEQLAVTYSSIFSHVVGIAGGYYGCAGEHFHRQKSKWGERGLLYVEPDQERLLSSLTQGQLHRFFIDNKSFWAPAYQNPFYRAVQLCLRQGGHRLEDKDIMWKRIQEHLRALENQQLIDPTKNLGSQKVLIYHGRQDQVVNPLMARHWLQWRKRAGSQEAQLILAEGAHTFPSNNPQAASCLTEAPPYVGYCQYDMSMRLLEFIGAPPLPHHVLAPYREIQLKKVSQNIDEKPLNISDYGYALGPKWCWSNPKRCDIHVALHGCQMNDEFDLELHHEFEKKWSSFLNLWLEERYPQEMLPRRKPNMGLWQWIGMGQWPQAVRNKALIILFPQTSLRSDTHYPWNPSGCWDWFGWTSPDYANKKSPEMKWLMRWLNWLIEQEQLSAQGR